MVVKKQIIKWLDIGVLYPIIDNKWVSPVQYVLRKGWDHLVPNKKNELVFMRPVMG